MNVTRELMADFLNDALWAIGETGVNAARDAVIHLAAAAMVTQALGDVARSIHRLGTADAATPMGAVEFLAGELRGGIEAVADSLREKG